MLTHRRFARNAFQSPRGDFGFLKIQNFPIGSRWCCPTFQSPRGDFGFLKEILGPKLTPLKLCSVSIPSRGFWFFEVMVETTTTPILWETFQSPRGDFGFLKFYAQRCDATSAKRNVSIPSRGFWFFEDTTRGAYHRKHAEDEFQSPRGDFGFLKDILSGLFVI